MSVEVAGVRPLPVVETFSGSMGCGKTEALLSRVRRLRVAKRKVTLATHASDTRYAVGRVVSHNKDGMPAEAVRSLLELREECLLGVEYLAVDEAQFFETLYDDMLVLHSRYPKLKFIFAGLSLYSNGKPFGDLHRIIPWAISTSLFAVCNFCQSERATMTACTRMKASDVEVGEVNSDDSGYYAACIECWSVYSKS